jgi:hypothetical protein
MKRAKVGVSYMGYINGNLAEKLSDRVMEEQLESSYKAQGMFTTINGAKRKHPQIKGKCLERLLNFDSLLQFEQEELESKLQFHGYSQKDISLLKKCLTYYKYYTACLNAFKANERQEANNYVYYNYCRGRADSYKSFILQIINLCL